MKLPETGEANSTMATREGCGGGDFGGLSDCKQRPWDGVGHVSYHLCGGHVHFLSSLLQQLPVSAPRKLEIRSFSSQEGKNTVRKNEENLNVTSLSLWPVLFQPNLNVGGASWLLPS